MVNLVVNLILLYMHIKNGCVRHFHVERGEKAFSRGKGEENLRKSSLPLDAVNHRFDNSNCFDRCIQRNRGVQCLQRNQGPIILRAFLDQFINCTFQIERINGGIVVRPA